MCERIFFEAPFMCYLISVAANTNEMIFIVSSTIVNQFIRPMRSTNWFLYAWIVTAIYFYTFGQAHFLFVYYTTHSLNIVLFSCLHCMILIEKAELFIHHRCSVFDAFVFQCIHLSFIQYHSNGKKKEKISNVTICETYTHAYTHANAMLNPIVFVG